MVVLSFSLCTNAFGVVVLVIDRVSLNNAHSGKQDDFKRCDSGPPSHIRAFTTEFIDSFQRFCCGEICCPTSYVCCESPHIVGTNGNKCARKDACNQNSEEDSVVEEEDSVKDSTQDSSSLLVDSEEDDA